MIDAHLPFGPAQFVRGVLHDAAGAPYEIKNAICLHEEDNAVLWKHDDALTGAEVRRQRRLMVSCHVTVANYEYPVYWRFYQDGNIECEVHPARLEGREPGQAEPARHPGRLQTGSRRRVPGPDGSLDAAISSGARDRSHPVGHAAR